MTVSNRDNQPDDIIDAIAEVIDLGPDAATWRPEPAVAPSDDRFSAVFLGTHQGEVFVTNREQVSDRIRQLVGDPFIGHVELVTGVDFWFGDDGMVTSGLNVVASHAIGALLRAVADGDYATSDDDREHARALLADPGAAPLLFGPCVVTGVNRAGTDPGPLGDTFWTWFMRYFEQFDIARVMQRLTEARSGRTIPIEAIHRIVILGQ